MSAAEYTFPPESWLGFGLDMTKISPLNIDEVTNNVIRTHRLIKLSTVFENSKDLKWRVPSGVSVAPDIRTSDDSLNTFSSGLSASQELAADDSLRAEYMAVKGQAGMSYALSNAFHKSSQYALYSYNQKLVEAVFSGWGDHIDEPALKKGLRDIASKPFDSTKRDIINSYRHIFSTLGSHVITGATYGAKFQLNLSAAKSDTEVNSNFAANVKALFNGVVSKGKYEASIKTKEHYQRFVSLMQYKSTIAGGDPDLRASLQSNTTADDVLETFKQWQASARAHSDVISFETISLWDIMGMLDDSTLKDRADDIEKAFKYLSSHASYKCRFVIDSDWAEFNLLSPVAFIKEDPTTPFENVVERAATRVALFANHERARTIDFLIKYDGSPVRFRLGHGVDDSQGGSKLGKCQVNINGRDFINNEQHAMEWTCDMD